MQAARHGSILSLSRSLMRRQTAPSIGRLIHPSTHRVSLLASAATPSWQSTGLRRSLSTSVAKAETTTLDKPKKASEKNIFLDNLGTIFLSVIGLIVASLVRSFYGSTRKNVLRDKLEEEAALDPIEVDDLRFANSQMTVSVFRSLVQSLREQFPSGQASYPEFVTHIREQLQSKHSIPTVELGHLLDRVALQVSTERQTRSDEPQSLTLWLVLLSLALNAAMPDRIRVLYEILENETNDSMETPMVTLLKVRDLVSHLQATSQLVVETQIIPTEGQAYPIQHYHRGTPDELVHWDGSIEDKIDIDALAGILRSKAVCAWGECYSKKKFV
jgi:hypothetical protein